MKWYRGKRALDPKTKMFLEELKRRVELSIEASTSRMNEWIKRQKNQEDGEAKKNLPPA